VTTPDSHPHGGCSGLPPKGLRPSARRPREIPGGSRFPLLSLSCVRPFSSLRSLSRALSVLVLVCVVVPWLSLGRFGRLSLLLEFLSASNFFLSSFRSFLCRRMHTQTDFWALKESVVLFGFRAPPLPRRRRPPPPHVCSTRSRTPK